MLSPGPFALVIASFSCLACAERPQPGKVSVMSSAAAGNPASPARSVSAAVPADDERSVALVGSVPTASAAVAPSVAAASATPAASAAPVVATPNADDELSESKLLAADGTPLPQTEDRPATTSPLFQRRVALLAEAIVKDDPSLARAAFFPVVAYGQVKAVAKPERDWRFRLMRNFERDIHEYHRALGADAARAKLAGVEVNEAQARWMKPGSEGNRLGYYRVLRARLRFSTESGKNRDFEITSLISWRGEWYVVHLHGFE